MAKKSEKSSKEPKGSRAAASTATVKKSTSAAKKKAASTSVAKNTTAAPKKTTASKQPKKAASTASKSKPASKKEAVTPAPDATVPTVVKPGTDKATKKQAKKSKKQTESFSRALRVGEGFDLASLDAGSTPGFDGGRKAAEKLMASTAEELSELQECLFASERHHGGRNILLVVQGMDTSGKGGIMRHVVGMVDPQGVQITGFKAPTAQELSHPFLWRIRNALPKPGYVGVFDRSHYEDVLVARVHDLVARPTWMRRYVQIKTFEQVTATKGTTIIKVFLHIDADEQKKRLAERLDNPEKHYKFNPHDLDERAYWEEYQKAYQAVLDRTSTRFAPWYVVPANHKWYARLAVQQLLLEHLRALDLHWPEAAFDVEEQKARLAKS